MMEFMKLMIEHPLFACGLGLFIIVLVMILGNGCIGILQVFFGKYSEDAGQRKDDEDND